VSVACAQLILHTRAHTHKQDFKKLWAELDDEVRNSDAEVLEQMNELTNKLGA
jgi:hypothetical protein